MSKLLPLLLLVGGLLSPACAAREIRVPVRPEPCGAPAFPDLMVTPEAFTPVDSNGDGEVDVLVIAPDDVALLAAWVVGVAEWHDAVAACPYLRTGPDLRDSVPGAR